MLVFATLQDVAYMPNFIALLKDDGNRKAKAAVLLA